MQGNTDYIGSLDDSVSCISCDNRDVINSTNAATQSN